MEKVAESNEFYQTIQRSQLSIVFVRGWVSGEGHRVHSRFFGCWWRQALLPLNAQGLQVGYAALDCDTRLLLSMPLQIHIGNFAIG